MKIWRVCFIVALPIALILLFAGIAMQNPIEKLTMIVGGVGAAHFAFLPAIADRLFAERNRPRISRISAGIKE